MKCSNCGGSLHGLNEGLVLECNACAKFVADCRCRDRLDYTPLRQVHCMTCDEYFIETVDTTTAGWRGLEI